MVIALANLGYTIYKSVNDGKDSVAYYQFLSPIVLALTMVWDWDYGMGLGLWYGIGAEYYGIGLGLSTMVWDLHV